MQCELRMSGEQVLEVFGGIKMQMQSMHGTFAKYYLEQHIAGFGALCFSATLPLVKGRALSHVLVCNAYYGGANLTVGRVSGGFLFIQTLEKSWVK